MKVSKSVKCAKAKRVSKCSKVEKLRSCKRFPFKEKPLLTLRTLQTLQTCKLFSYFLVVVLTIFSIESATAQDVALRYGTGVPAAVRIINDRGLRYLANSQMEDGGWSGAGSGPGVTGICVMALMASGEDPDFGPYAMNIRKALRNIISNQDARTGYIGGTWGGHGSMYQHGFASLALSEAYGAVSERLLWEGSDVPPERRRPLSEALELAVRSSLTSQQKNPWGAWRYSPDSQDADTTVAGTVLMGILGARNAGIEIPNEAVDKAVSFFQTHTMQNGSVTYQMTSSHGGGLTRSAIGVLIYAIAKRKDTPEYKAASEFIKRRIDHRGTGHLFYNLYYMAQALFQSDFEAWKAWNQRTIEWLQETQAEDGSFSSSHGRAYGTGMAILALALNYRLLPIYER